MCFARWIAQIKMTEDLKDTIPHSRFKTANGQQLAAKLSTVHYQLSTINYPLQFSVISSQLSGTYPLSQSWSFGFPRWSTIHYPLSTTNYPLSTIHYPLSTINYPLSTIYNPSPYSRFHRSGPLWSSFRCGATDHLSVFHQTQAKPLPGCHPGRKIRSAPYIFLS